MNTFTRCDDIGALTYYSNGDVFPCCSAAITTLVKLGNSNPLRLGNIYENTLEELVVKAQTSPFIAALVKTGSSGLKALSKQYPNDFKFSITGI